MSQLNNLDIRQGQRSLGDTPSHASDYLCHTGRECIQNCTCCRVDTARCAIFWQFYYKVMAEWPWRYMSRSHVIVHDTPSHTSDHLCQIWEECIQNCMCCTADTTRWPYCSTFIAKSWRNDLADIGQGQRSLHATHPLMLVINCAKYEKYPFRTVCAAEQTQQDCSSSIAKSWLNDLEDIGRGQRLLCMTHFPILVIIHVSYGKNLSRTVGVIERTQNRERRTDGRTDGGTDGRTKGNQYSPQQLRCAGGII